MPEPDLLLASNSPRRRQLMALIGRSFRLLPVDIDETLRPGEAPDAYVLRLAESKARAAAQRSPGPGMILAADTTVADDQGVLVKPADAADAAAMLRRLRGRTHQVYTALAVYCALDGELLTGLCLTQVTMREYSEEEIAEYVASGDPLDKAGAYAVQHAGFHPVERLEGCYTNVVGLPLCLMEDLLVKAGLRRAANLPLCPEVYDTCPVCSALARGEHEI